MVVFGGAESSPKLQVLACEVRTVTSRPLAVADRPATQGSGVALVPASQSATSAPFRKTSTLVSSAAGGSSESSRRNCSTRGSAALASGALIWTSWPNRAKPLGSEVVVAPSAMVTVPATGSHHEIAQRVVGTGRGVRGHCPCGWSILGSRVEGKSVAEASRLASVSSGSRSVASEEKATEPVGGDRGVEGQSIGLRAVRAGGTAGEPGRVQLEIANEDVDARIGVIRMKVRPVRAEGDEAAIFRHRGIEGTVPLRAVCARWRGGVVVLPLEGHGVDVVFRVLESAGSRLSAEVKATERRRRDRGLNRGGVPTRSAPAPWRG